MKVIFKGVINFEVFLLKGKNFVESYLLLRFFVFKSWYERDLMLFFENGLGNY